MLRAADTIAKTDTGRQRRENEDSALARAPVFGVADGMGGAQAGEVASRIAIDAFEAGLGDSGSPEERLAGRVREANRQIYDRSRAEHGREGMGTTLTAAYLDGSNLAIAHVGDSRAYLLRDGELKRLTRDHSLVDELVRQGKLTEEQAAEHPQRSIITRAPGAETATESPASSRSTDSAVAVASRPPGVTTKLSPRREEPPATSARTRRFSKPLAIVVALVIVLFLVVGGGYLATRQLYFIGTNAQGIVTIYRGLPYELPAGIHLYETYLVSGVPGSLVPSDRRKEFFNNQLRSQSEALNLVRQLELGRISR